MNQNYLIQYNAVLANLDHRNSQAYVVQITTFRSSLIQFIEGCKQESNQDNDKFLTVKI